MEGPGGLLCKVSSCWRQRHARRGAARHGRRLGNATLTRSSCMHAGRARGFDTARATPAFERPGPSADMLSGRGRGSPPRALTHSAVAGGRRPGTQPPARGFHTKPCLGGNNQEGGPCGQPHTRCRPEGEALAQPGGKGTRVHPPPSSKTVLLPTCNSATSAGQRPVQMSGVPFRAPPSPHPHLKRRRSRSTTHLRRHAGPTGPGSKSAQCGRNASPPQQGAACAAPRCAHRAARRVTPLARRKASSTPLHIPQMNPCGPAPGH